MSRRVIALLFASYASLLPCKVAAQDVTPPPASMHATGLVGGVFHFAGNVGGDFASQATYPFRLARNHPFGFAAGVAGLVGLMSYDGEVRESVASPQFARDHGLEAPAQFISDAAGPSRMIPIVAGFGVLGMVGSPRERATSSMLAEALITSSVWTGALKELTRRERPRETLEEFSDFNGPGALFYDEGGVPAGLRSFPSGHTSGAWAMATVIAHQYPSHGIVPLLAYGTATAMGYSRMVVGAHWLSDVVAGGLIGFGCARQVISAHETRALAADQVDRGGWHLYLESDRDVHGAGLAFQF
ncbi:MAG TPA: phosphatase PAP2 family protein [Candidatus Krumholzibacteria bacterium]|nr:phosphatase PAP2 family protein [Candidatus Krumholzibacteria bacterium]